MFGSSLVGFYVLVQMPGPAERTMTASEGTHVAFGLVLVHKLVLGQMGFQFETTVAVRALKGPNVNLKIWLVKLDY
jgi:hypothetical protein